MSSSKNLVEFPDVEAKLQKPSKQSAFEKQRADAEAKKAREAAETAAVYEDFIKSFDREDDDDGGRQGSFPAQRLPAKPQGFGAAPLGGAAASKRHFGSSSLRSGPGSLGPPPNSFGRKRGFDSYSRGDRDRDGRGVLGFDDRDGDALPVSRAFNTSDDEDEKTGARAEELAVARPTLRLSHLPPGTSPAMIKSLVPSSMTVENVKILPPMGPSGMERKCTVAIVTLSQETPATDIDAAVSSLQNRYLGYGYYLSLHRHLSSAVATSATVSALGASSAGSHPFGAKPVAQQAAPGNANTQQSFGRGFAPPTSYGPNIGGPINRSSLLHVPVHPPQDVKILQLINKVIESVLEHGPEFEALLMSRSEVQREEKWAWIWDSRTEGGVWYRWRLWEIVTGSISSKTKGKYLPLFDGSHAWKSPEKSLAFEYTTNIDEFVSDSDYNSSDDEDADGDGNRDNNQGAEAESTFLNPLEKAKLTHLLSRLPTTLSKIRKGDIARVTTFAITHASRGADEVVDMIVANVDKPFALTTANPERHQDGREKGKQKDDSDGSSPEPEDKAAKEGPDLSAASLVGLYVVNDILSSSSTSGVRHAWRFRQLFEGALKDRKIFENLGMMADKLQWGRLRAEKWKRSVGLILNLWEGWCAFPAESQEFFVNSFENPPSLKVEERVDESSKKGRWKLVEAATPAAAPEASTRPSQLPITVIERAGSDKNDDVDGEPMDEEDVAGEPMDEEDVAGEPIDDEDVEGEPMGDDDVDGEPMDEDSGEEEAGRTASPLEDGTGGNAAPHGVESGLLAPSKQAGLGRKRMRAVDMFADSGDSDEGG